MKPLFIVLGATGGIGRAVVRAALAAGYPVAAVARREDGLASLRTEHGQSPITLVPGSVATDAQASALAEDLRALDRPIAGIVASVCGTAGACRGRVLDQSTSLLQGKLEADLLPHLAAARHLLPLLVEAGRGGYLMVGGPGSERPWAGYGHRSIAAAALRMLAMVLHDEARALSVRVQLLTVDLPVATEHNQAHAGSQWPRAQTIAEHAVALVTRSGADEAVVHYPRQSPSISASSFGPGSEQPPADARCQSLADIRALLGRFSLAGSNKDQPS